MEKQHIAVFATQDWQVKDNETICTPIQQDKFIDCSFNFLILHCFAVFCYMWPSAGGQNFVQCNASFFPPQAEVQQVQHQSCLNGWNGWNVADPTAVASGSHWSTCTWNTTSLPHPSQSFGAGFTGNSADGWAPSMVSNMMLNTQQQFDSFDPEEEKRYKGTVKCFYGEKHTGHGFIACPEIYNRTRQDVYLHARQAHRCEVGDEVSFSVVFNSRKEPQARSVVKKEEERKFLSKKREEAERQATALQQKRTRITVSAFTAPSQPAVMTEEQAKKFQKSLKGR